MSSARSEWVTSRTPRRKPTPTHRTLLPRWAATPDAVGKRLEVLHNRCEMKLVARARQAPEPHALEAVMGLQVREAHLGLRAFVARPLELRRVDKCASYITGIFVDVPAQPSERHVRCALRLQRAGSPITRAGALTSPEMFPNHDTCLA